MTIAEAISILDRSKNVISEELEVFFIDEGGEYFNVTSWEITEEGVSFKV